MINCFVFHALRDPITFILYLLERYLFSTPTLLTEVIHSMNNLLVIVHLIDTVPWCLLLTAHVEATLLENTKIITLVLNYMSALLHGRTVNLNK